MVQLREELGHVAGVIAIVFNNQYLSHGLAIVLRCLNPGDFWIEKIPVAYPYSLTGRIITVDHFCCKTFNGTVSCG